jgi:hypothetical protein
MAEPLPLILTDAGLKISKTNLSTGLTELACVANHIELSPDVSITTVDTMCGSKDYPGQVKWSLLATLYQSFDPAATEEVLSAAVSGGVPVPFSVIGYKSKPVAVTNPMWTGMVIPQPYSPINGDAGDASEVELEWALQAAPTKITSGTYLAEAQDYNALTRAQLDEEASAAGLDPAAYATKADIVAALEGTAAPA